MTAAVPVKYYKVRKKYRWILDKTRTGSEELDEGTILSGFLDFLHGDRSLVDNKLAWLWETF